MSAEASESIGVAIVSFEARDALRECLRSLAECTSSPFLRIAVVDNASSDGSADMVAAEFPDAVLVRNGENVGFARASNQAFRATSGDLVLFLNGDAMVGAGTIETMARKLRSLPELGVVGPRIRDERGHVEPSFGRDLSLLSEAVRKLWNLGYANGGGPLRALVESRYARERFVDWVSGACLMTRRSLLDEVGGLDESYFLYAEDVDLCARVRASGARVLYTPEAEARHRRGASAVQNRERAFLESQRSRLLFYRKHRGAWSVALLKLYMAASAIVSYLVRPSTRGLQRRVLGMVREFHANRARSAQE